MPPAPGQVSSLFCEVCKRQFPSAQHLHQHKVHSAAHNYCEICRREFFNDAALKQHHDLCHPADQNLQCPGCKKIFNRLGAFIAHLEQEKCSKLSKADLDAMRRAKQQAQGSAETSSNPDAQSSTRIISRAGNTPANERSTVEGRCYLDMDDAELAALSSHLHMRAAEPVRFEGNSGDDLIMLHAAGSDMNVGWNTEIGIESPMIAGGTKLLTLMDSLIFEHSATGDRRTDNAVAFARGLAQSRSPVMPDAEANPYDPDSPGFNITTYYVSFLGKYKCPYLGCGKGHASANGFLQHLKSPTHRNEKLACINCHRYYASTTALTQHMESQGVRCKAREMPHYDRIIDQVTGGVATAAGRHADDTVKYAISENITQLVGGLAKANDAVHASKNDNFNTYWDDKGRDIKW